VDGAAFATEVGDEIGSFQRNLAIGSTGSGENINSRIGIQDFGHQGDGFWFQGAGISVTDNVAAGNTGHAFVFYTRALTEAGIVRTFLAENLPQPSIANGAETIDVGHVPVIEFARNTGYASTQGLNLRYHLLGAAHTQLSYFRDSTFWNNAVGIDLPYTNQTVLQNLRVIHAPGTYPLFAVTSNFATRNIVYDNLTVTGYRWGIRLPIAGYSVVNGGYYDNREDFVVETAVSPDRLVWITGPIVFGATAGGPQNEVTMRPVFDRLDGTASYAFYQDRVFLNYGPYTAQRVYFDVQAASAIPFPTATGSVPSQYIGLTNQQLWNLFGIAIGGEIAPANATTAPNIVGLVAPPA
jgi:hypothetical protein